jgi:peptide/nickel transport system ATP-binding protein
LLALDNGHRVRCHLREEQGPAGPRQAARDAPSSVSRRAAAGKLLEARELQVHFPIRRGVLRRTVGHVRAVDGISLDIHAGRTLALVGESGCGKTTVGKGLLQLERPTGGSVMLYENGRGSELTQLSRAQLRARRSAMQIIFQDPYASLNPRMRVAEILLEGMKSLRVGNDDAERVRLADEMLGRVGLPPESKERYPHEFSGGQRQRIAIARALTVHPKLIVCDEPTSALDVSVQAQILNLLRELQERLGIAYLFITHNIAVVEYLAHEVAVMYLGRIVEHGTVEEVLDNPKHPYTRALLSAVPRIEDGGRRVIRLGGDLPSAVNPPSGCHFHPRCPDAMEHCRNAYPHPVELSPTRTVKCFLYGNDEG